MVSKAKSQPWLFTGAAKKSEVQLAHAKLLGEAKATEVRYDRHTLRGSTRVSKLRIPSAFTTPTPVLAFI